MGRLKLVQLVARGPKEIVRHVRTNTCMYNSDGIAQAANVQKAFSPDSRSAAFCHWKTQQFVCAQEAEQLQAR